MTHLKNIRISLIILLLGLLAIPIFAQSEIVITARQNLALQSKPDYDSDVLGVFQRGQEAAAFGRDEAGAWLQINDGWVIAKNVDAAADIMALPVTTNAVTVKAAASRSLRSGPDGSFDATGNLPSGETALALGRNGDGSWLQVSDGWIPADQVEISGGVMQLPVTFSSITIRANQNVALHRGPSRDAEVLAILARGEEAIATSRNEAGTAVQTPQGWVFINRGLALDGDIMDLPITGYAGITITAKLETGIRSGPSERVKIGILRRGEEAIAFGRNEKSTRLQIESGWVLASYVKADGNIMDLPVTSGESSTQSIAKASPRDGITITAKRNTPVRTRSSALSDRLSTLQRGEEAIAFGRNKAGTWLQIKDGWVAASWVKADGDKMDLPVTSGESSTQSVAKTSSRDGVTITLTRSDRLPVRNAPGVYSKIVRSLRRGEKVIAIGRDQRGDWLQIEDGWIYSGSVKADGSIMSLPITSGESSTQSVAKPSSRDGVTITSTAGSTIRSEPGFGRNVVGSLQRGEETVAIGRNERGTWLQIESGWVVASLVKKVDGNIMDLPVTSGESSTQSIAKASPRDGITIASTLSSGSIIRSSPGFGNNMVGRLQKSEEALAIGRNERGDWLQIEDGWIWASPVRADGDIMLLPVTSGESSTQSIAKTSSRDGVTITLTRFDSLPVRNAPRSDVSVRFLQKGEETLTIGRDQAGTWLQIEDGWVYGDYFRIDGDIMSLPVTWEESSTSSTTTSTGRATPTPSRSSSATPAFNEQTIRSRVNRYTDDIRILKITQSGSVTEIEYDLKPWPFVPNEQIAHEVLFKVICALRRGGQIPHKLEFTGQGHFKSDVGRKFKSPSVEIHISANNANRVICSGNSYSDINWRSLAARYQSYPIPRGASVDYG